MTTTRIRFTEYLDLDLDAELWRCNRCDAELVSARRPYKEGCLVHERDPREIHPPLIEGAFTFSPDPCHPAIRSPSTSSSTSTG